MNCSEDTRWSERETTGRGGAANPLSLEGLLAAIAPPERLSLGSKPLMGEGWWGKAVAQRRLGDCSTTLAVVMAGLYPATQPATASGATRIGIAGKRA